MVSPSASGALPWVKLAEVSVEVGMITVDMIKKVDVQTAHDKVYVSFN